MPEAQLNKTPSEIMQILPKITKDDTKSDQKLRSSEMFGFPSRFQAANR